MPVWYYDKKDLKNSPSTTAGVTYEDEIRYRREGARFIQELGKSLGLRHDTMATACNYFHRFYLFHPFSSFPRYVTATCALFLAGKAEETPKKCRDIIKSVKELLNSHQFSTFGQDPREEVMTLERVLLQTIKFDLQVDHPYSSILKYAKCLEGDSAKLQKMVQMSWTFVNDSLCTTLCLQWEPEVIAIALMYLAAKLSKFEVKDWKNRTDDHRFWWDQYVKHLSQEILEDICHQVLDLYTSPAKAAKEAPPSPPPGSRPPPAAPAPQAPSHKSAPSTPAPQPKSQSSHHPPKSAPLPPTVSGPLTSSGGAQPPSSSAPAPPKPPPSLPPSAPLPRAPPMQPVSAASAPAVPPLGSIAAHPPLGSAAAPGAGMVQHSTANYSQQALYQTGYAFQQRMPSYSNQAPPPHRNSPAPPPPHRNSPAAPPPHRPLNYQNLCAPPPSGYLPPGAPPSRAPTSGPPPSQLPQTHSTDYRRLPPSGGDPSALHMRAPPPDLRSAPPPDLRGPPPGAGGFSRGSTPTKDAGQRSHHMNMSPAPGRGGAPSPHMHNMAPLTPSSGPHTPRGHFPPNQMQNLKMGGNHHGNRGSPYQRHPPPHNQRHQHHGSGAGIQRWN